MCATEYNVISEKENTAYDKDKQYSLYALKLFSTTFNKNTNNCLNCINSKDKVWMMILLVFPKLKRTNIDNVMRGEQRIVYYVDVDIT